MTRTRKWMLVGVLSTAMLGVTAMMSFEAEAAVCYDRYGRKIIVDPSTISAAYNCYNSAGVAIIIYPVAPAYVPGPYYGPAGVNGVARRTSRRTSRRVHRRHH